MANKGIQGHTNAELWTLSRQDSKVHVVRPPASSCFREWNHFRTKWTTKPCSIRFQCQSCRDLHIQAFTLARQLVTIDVPHSRATSHAHYGKEAWTLTFGIPQFQHVKAQRMPNEIQLSVGKHHAKRKGISGHSGLLPTADLGAPLGAHRQFNM